MSKKLGQYGENQAASYLRKKGFNIIKKNYYTRYGELDIICRKNREIIFVEVKTRRSINCGTPEEAVTYKKIQRIKKAALIFLNENRLPFQGLRFDVVTIVFDQNGKEVINHIEDAF